jgi:hypothetical protein
VTAVLLDVITVSLHSGRSCEILVQSLMGSVSLTRIDCIRHKASVYTQNKLTMSRLTSCRTQLWSRPAQLSLEIAWSDKSDSVTLGAFVLEFISYGIGISALFAIVPTGKRALLCTARQHRIFVPTLNARFGGVRWPCAHSHYDMASRLPRGLMPCR